VRDNGLWAGVHCPELTLDAIGQVVADAGPVAVHEQVRSQVRIVQANRLAQEQGVRPGQRLAAALAIVPGLQSHARNRRAEQQLLEQVALVGYDFSHQVALAPPDGIVLEIAGSRRLRGSITALLEALTRQLHHRGLAVRLGLAPVPAAARLLARLGCRAPTLAELHRQLAGLPIDRLDLEPDQADMLAGCGVKTVAELMKRPTADRTRRFGPSLNRYLDQIHGRLETPLAHWAPAQRFNLRLELPTASDEVSALVFVFKRMLGRLGDWLRVRDQALAGLKVSLEREDGGSPLTFRVSLARQGFDGDRLLELIGLKLEQIRLPAAVDAISLKADSTDQHRPPQADLFSAHNRADAWPALLDRLGARLGENGLAGLAPRMDHRPEKSWAWIRPGRTGSCPEQRPRPTWLLPEPRPCKPEHIHLEEGPERIEYGWWDGQDCRRDYWIARDPQQRRLWVFREYKPRTGWFIHGIFD
jgi:protein ImuB